MTSPFFEGKQSGSDRKWKLIWNDEFDQAEIDQTRWRSETISPNAEGNMSQAAQHAVNTYGITEDGTIDKTKFPIGKRHGGWYNDYRDKVQYIKNQQLHLGGYVSNDRDLTMLDSHHPYRDDFEGKEIDLRNKVYTSWIDTYATAWRDGSNRPDPSAPNQYWRGGYFEFSIDFSQMVTPGHRVSAWLLPAVDPATDIDESLIGKVYDDIAENGLEIDLFEYENTPGSEQLLLMKTIGSDAAGDKPVDASKFGFDLRKGKHIIGLMWTRTELIWFLNGVEVNRDETHVPWTAHAFYFTRELNTGIGTGEKGKPTSDSPYLQHDPGLYARNFGAYLDTIDDDVAIIDYLRIYQCDTDPSFNWISPHDVGESEVPDPMIVATVAKKNPVEHTQLPTPTLEQVMDQVSALQEQIDLYNQTKS